MSFLKDFKMPRLCHIKATDDDPLVKNDLAITPSRMYELAMQGTPINEQTAAHQHDFIDGYRGDIDFEPPHIYARHADIISCYEQQISSREQVNQYAESLNQSNED